MSRLLLSEEVFGEENRERTRKEDDYAKSFWDILPTIKIFWLRFDFPDRYLSSCAIR